MNSLKWLATTLFCLVVLNAHAQEWTRFRGPNGTGAGKAQGIPSSWSASDVLWKSTLPGVGHSSPVLWGNKLFTTTFDESDRSIRVICLDAETGESIWNQAFPFQPYQMHQYNQFASSTPAVDGDHVYVWQASPSQSQFIAFRHDGSTAWKREFGAFQSAHGGAPSPIVYRDKVILVNDHQGPSFILAMDRMTGDTVWRLARNSTRQAAYGTPCLFEREGKSPWLIVNSTDHGITAIHPDNGQLAWELDDVFDKRSVSSSVAAGGLFIGSCGSGGGGNYVVAVRPGDDAGRKPELVYQVRRSAPYVPTSVYHDGLLYLWSDGGIVTCLEAESGETIWNERVGGDYFASPILIENRLFGVSTTGDVVVLKTGRDFEVLGRSSMGETSHATPAVANGKLFIRTMSQIYCIGK